jgi:hypothetical protein
MNRFSAWRSGTALVISLGITSGAIAPLVLIAPAQAQTTFSDVQSGYWADRFITDLSNRGVIQGFPDGTFRPDDPVTRAQFAAMVRQAFRKSSMRTAVNFVDVQSNYWAYTAIQEAYTTGFLSGYPGNVFNPGQNIPRAQVLVSLTSGLGYTVNSSTSTLLGVYQDANQIPDYASSGVAAATQKAIVVNYPNVAFLNPNRATTRAEVAAFIYQALVSSGSASVISSPYIVTAQTPPSSPPTQNAQTLATGTRLPVRYTAAEKIYVSPEEPNPVPVTLQVDRNVTSPSGTVLIPANSQVVGELRNVTNGTQFHARELVLTNGTRMSLNATSSVVTTTTTIRRGANVAEILGGAAAGSAAAAVIAAVTGDRHVAPLEVLGGTTAGTLLGLFLGRNQATLYTINPDTDLDLTLNAPLTVR